MSERYRSGGTGPLMIVLVLGVLLAGLVYTFWGQITSHLTKTQPAKVAEEARERPAKRRVEEPVTPARRRSPRGRREPEAKPVALRAKSAVVSREREKALGIRQRADEAVNGLDFDLAAELYVEEADALAHDAKGAARARALASKVRTFSKLTKDLKPNPAARSGMVTLKMHSGNDIADVVLVDETDDAYVIARRGMTVEVARQRVRAVARMTPEEQAARLLREFKAIEGKNRDSSGAGYFLLADRAYRDSLKGKALEYLEKAYAKDGEDLPKQVRVAQAKKLLSLAIWCESTGRTRTAQMYCSRVARLYADLPELVAEANEFRDKLSKPVAVADYKSTVKIKVRKAAAKPSAEKDVAPEDEETTIVTEKVSSGSAKNAKLMAEINRLFDQAMDHYVKGRPGSPNSNQHLHKAAALFDKVSSLCDQALRNDPGNSQIESRQADASRYAYHSRKMSTLSLF